MKKVICSLILWGLFILSFACSSTHNTITEEKPTEIEYIIHQDSISTFQLHKLMGHSVKKLTVITEDSGFQIQKISEINDSTVTIISRPDYEGYEKTIEQFKKDYFDDKVTSENYPKCEPADTLEIAISDIRAINYSIYKQGKYLGYEQPYTDNVNRKYSESDLIATGIGYEFDFRKDELTAGFFMQMQTNFYRPIIEVNTTINTSQENIWVSSSALYTLGYSIIATIIVKTIKGEPVDRAIGGVVMNEVTREKSDNDLLSFLVFSPLLLTNAEHHIIIIDPISSENTSHLGLSIFVEFRTDIYDPEWIVYSPGYGIQFEFVRGKKEVKDTYYSMYLQTGLEYPYNFQLGDFQKSRLFAGLKFSF